MGWEPITHCRECGDTFDVYQAPEDRICECCAEVLAIEAKQTAHAANSLSRLIFGGAL